MNHEICSLPPLSGYFSLIIIVLHGEFQQLYREILAAFHQRRIDAYLLSFGEHRLLLHKASFSIKCRSIWLKCE